MRRVEVWAPGSCGEFIQGRLAGRPCLVSCPVDIYARAVVCEGKPADYIEPKAEKLLTAFFEYCDLPREEKHQLQIALASPLPREKGMASSTADLMALSGALAAYYEVGLSETEVARLCAAVEPSDNLMFSKCNLFDQVAGEILRPYDQWPAGDIFIVSFAGKVNTDALHRSHKGDSAELEAEFAEILAEFEAGLAAGDKDRIGAAATCSGALNQKVLYKPFFSTLAALSKECGGHGVIAGHSGTVLGIYYTKETFDHEAFQAKFAQKVPAMAYDEAFSAKVIAGGMVTQK